MQGSHPPLLVPLFPSFPCVCVCVSYQAPGGRLLVSEMSGVNGEIRLVCSSHGGRPTQQRYHTAC